MCLFRTNTQLRILMAHLCRAARAAKYLDRNGTDRISMESVTSEGGCLRIARLRCNLLSTVEGHRGLIIQDVSTSGKVGRMINLQIPLKVDPAHDTPFSSRPWWSSSNAAGLGERVAGRLFAKATRVSVVLSRIFCKAAGSIPWWVWLLFFLRGKGGLRLGEVGGGLGRRDGVDVR